MTAKLCQSKEENCPEERFIKYLRQNGGRVTYDLAALANTFNEGRLFVITTIGALHGLGRIHLAGDDIHLNPEN
ncbi:MAG: hypothetical protein V4526_01620 [Patescibacteria group bacterium]